MSTKKTIQINPELFKLTGNRTRKNRIETPELKLTPLVSPNNLKSKLLNRIKEHKMQELKQKNKETSSENNGRNNDFYESNSPVIMSNENSDNSDDELEMNYIDNNRIVSNNKNEKTS